MMWRCIVEVNVDRTKKCIIKKFTDQLLATYVIENERKSLLSQKKKKIGFVVVFKQDFHVPKRSKVSRGAHMRIQKFTLP